MKSDLIEVERKALQLRNTGQLKKAAELFEVIVREQPDWEHGTAFFNLACCYEDLGELSLAEKCYRDALRCEPKNSYFIGGLASFLYLHSDIEKAFAAYLTFLEVERMNGNQRGIEKAITALQSLGRKWDFRRKLSQNKSEQPNKAVEGLGEALSGILLTMNHIARGPGSSFRRTG